MTPKYFFITLLILVGHDIYQFFVFLYFLYKHKKYV